MVERHRYSIWNRLGFKQSTKQRRAYDFPIPGRAVKNANPADIFQIVQPVGHFGEISGNEMIFFLQLLFVKRIERESVKRTVHQDSPPALE